MKNMVKLLEAKRSLAIVAFFAVITVAASAQAMPSFTAGWPPANVLAGVGVQNFPQPAGITNVQYAIQEQGPQKSLTIIFVPGPATGAAVTGWFTANGWIQQAADGDIQIFFNMATQMPAVYAKNAPDSNIPAGSYSLTFTSFSF